MKIIIYFLFVATIFSLEIESYVFNKPEDWRKIYMSPEVTSINSNSYRVSGNLLVEIIDTEINKMLGLKTVLEITDNIFFTDLTIANRKAKLYQKIKDEQLTRYIAFESDKRSYLFIIDGTKEAYLNHEEEILSSLNSFSIKHLREDERASGFGIYYTINYPQHWKRDENALRGDYLKRDLYIIEDNSNIEILVSERRYSDLKTEVYWILNPNIRDIQVNNRQERLEALVPYIKITYIFRDREKRSHYFLYNGRKVIEIIYSSKINTFDNNIQEVDDLFRSLRLIM